jgi:hypothetical protein
MCVSSYFPRLTLIFLEFLFKIGRLATYFVETLKDYSIGQIDSDWTETLFPVLYAYILYKSGPLFVNFNTYFLE